MGIILGLMTIVIIGFIMAMIGMNYDWDLLGFTGSKIAFFAGVVLIISLIAIPISKHNKRKGIEQFKVTKVMIEENFNEHDFQNVSLMQTVLRWNNNLASSKYSQSTFMWGVYGVEEVQDLDPIIIPEKTNK